MAKLHSLREFVPSVLARPAFRALMPVKYRHLEGLKNHSATGCGDRSLKPFIDKQCIFVHIPKTAGISVNKALFGCVTGGHMTMLDYETTFSESEINGFFKFTFVRNPWDRAVSAYFYLKSGGINITDQQDKKRIIDPFHNFEEFVIEYLGGNRKFQKHFVPQFRFICTRPWAGPQVDFIGRYERLEEDFGLISKQLGSFSELPWENRSNPSRPDWRLHYSDAAAEIVAKTYSRDIELFDYSFDEVD